MKLFTRSIIHKLALALALPAGLLGVASNCLAIGYHYTLNVTEEDAFTLIVTDNDPNNMWTTTLTALPHDVWDTTGLPANGVVLPSGTEFYAEPGEANFVNEIVFGNADALHVSSDIARVIAAGNPVVPLNTISTIGIDSNGNVMDLVFNDLPGHNALGQDVPEAGSTASLLALSLLLTLLGADRLKTVSARR